MSRTPDEIEGALVMGGIVYAWSRGAVRRIDPLDWRERSTVPQEAVARADAIYLDLVEHAIYRVGSDAAGER